jgi:hypothetical protein
MRADDREETMSGSITHTIGIAQAQVASGQIGEIEIDKIAPGPAQVGALSLTGTSLAINSGSAFLRNVRFVLHLEITVTYSYDFGFGISGSGSEPIGSITFAMNAGDVLVPALNNIGLSVPKLTATNVTTSIAPIVNLILGGGGFTGIEADTIKTPSGGFQLGGLGLGAISIASVQVPDALVGKVSIADFSPQGNVVIPSVQLNNIHLPQASAADIKSTAPFAVNNIQASSQGLTVPLGPFSFGVFVTPTINTSIGSLELIGVSISGSVAQAEIQNISVPIAISGINLKTITIGAVDITNITL